MTQFVRIGNNNNLFDDQLPTEVTLPVGHTAPNGIYWVENVTTQQGDPGWEDALHRFMLHLGYCYREDNDQEMR